MQNNIAYSSQHDPKAQAYQKPGLQDLERWKALTIVQDNPTWSSTASENRQLEIPCTISKTESRASLKTLGLQLYNWLRLIVVEPLRKTNPQKLRLHPPRQL